MDSFVVKIIIPVLALVIAVPNVWAAPEDGLPPKEANLIEDGRLEKVEKTEKRDALAISEYQTNYFISGNPDTKIQLSFQFRLFTQYPVYFGYTQRMFWELFKEASSPFSDVNFMPEFFYRFDTPWGKLKNIEAGYLHMSNGEKEPESRSINNLYARLIWRGKFFSSLTLKYFHGQEATNRDFKQYVGPVELQVQLKNILPLKEKYAPQDFYLRLYTGGDFGERLDRTSLELSLRYRFFGSENSPGIFAQYFRGYGEKFLSYKEREESYRIGFSVGGDYRAVGEN